jgi:beta-lactamase superfamily II metal-dependent hydrolase
MQRSPIRCFLLLQRAVGAALAAFLVPAIALALGNGKLQIHHIDVGQGDGALLISPLGQTALFDDGTYTNCTNIKAYLQSLGITTVDYHFLSHYHADHLGCIDDLAAIGITIGTRGYDRGYSYSSASYDSYVATLGTKRTTIAKGQTITLDAGAANPVTITCVDLNGAGVYSVNGSDENAKSVALKVTYGAFDEEISGDLTGDVGLGNDVETTVGPEVGDIEVYKVHHHGSRYSTNDNWLNAVTPEAAIVSCGDGNTYGHPTADCLTRLHNHGVHTYWTETGAGVAPNPSWDKVGGTIVIQADPGVGATYTISGNGFTDSYVNGGGPPPPPPVNTTEFPSAVSVLKGSISAGDVARLAVSDDSRLSVSAGQSNNQYYTDWYGSVFLLHPPLNLTVTYEGSFTINRTQTLYLWNFATSAWDQINSGSVGSTDVTKTWSTASPGNYVSASREVRLRVLGNNRKQGSYTSRGDFMAFTYDYTQGTAPEFAAAQAHSSAAPTSGPVAPELPLSVLARLDAHGTRNGVELVWAVDRGAHVDGFNVYRQDAAGGRVFVGNEAMLGIHGDVAEFRFVDATPAAGEGTYWLGARGCSGPEAMIGPLLVSAAATAPASFRASPSLVREATRFEFDVPQRGDVQLDVYDVTGRKVASVYRGSLEPGTASLAWDRTTGNGSPAGPGVYFAKLHAFGRTQIARVTLLER